MQDILTKLFHIYPNEKKTALLFAFLGFIWALGSTTGLKFADALFLLHVGADSLPTAYLITSTILMVLAALLLWAFHAFSAYRVFFWMMGIGILFYIGIFSYLALGSSFLGDRLWFALKIFGTVHFTMLTTGYWTFIDQYFPLQDAKRLFSLFSSMVFLGVASTGMIMRSGLIEYRFLTLLIIGLFVLSSFWIFKIIKITKPVHDENSLEATASLGETSLKGVFYSIISSKFALLLMASNFMIYLLQTITEYNYMSSFEAYFAPHGFHESGSGVNASLTLFLGQCLTLVSLSNLLIGLFLYSRLVRRFGITSVLPITPIILILTYSGWMFDQSLIFPVLGLFVVEGTLYVIDDSNFNLLLNAVPAKLKYKIRIIIESFFEPIGMLISSFLLSFAFIDSRILGLILSVFALLIALLLGSQYIKAIYINLSDNAIHFHRSVKDWFVAHSPKARQRLELSLLATLKKEDAPTQILALECLFQLNDENILKRLLKEIPYLNDEGKIYFLELLRKNSFANKPEVIDLLYEWLAASTGSPLGHAIIFYLAKQGLWHPEKAQNEIGNDPLILRGAAIISLKKSWAHLAPTTMALNRNLAAQKLQELLDSKLEDEVCMGLLIVGEEGTPHDVDILMPYLKSPSLKIVRAAAASIALLANKQCIRHAKQLILHLKRITDNEFRLSCLKALGKIGESSFIRDIIASSQHFRPNERRMIETIIQQLGLRTVPILLAITKDRTLNDRCRVLAGRILGNLAPPQLKANLYAIINEEIERAYFYIYHHFTLQQAYPHYDLSMLQDSLLTSFRSVIDFIIQLLAVAGEVEDCELLSRSLRSRHPKVRSNVVETLEKTCENRIFRLLHPLVADIPHEEILRAYLKGGRQPYELNELLNTLSQSPIELDQMMGATFKYRLNLPNWRKSLRQQMLVSEEIFHHFGYELLET